MPRATSYVAETTQEKSYQPNKNVQFTIQVHKHSLSLNLRIMLEDNKFHGFQKMTANKLPNQPLKNIQFAKVTITNTVLEHLQNQVANS